MQSKKFSKMKSLRPTLIIDASCVLILIAIVLIIWQSVQALQPAKRMPTFWFEDIKSQIPIDDTQRAALIRFVATSLWNEKLLAQALPDALIQDTAPRIAFLTLNDGAAPAQVIFGTARGVAGAVRRVVLKTEQLMGAAYRPKRFKLDIVQSVHTVNSFDFEQRLSDKIGVTGLAFDKSSALAFLPGELHAYGLVDAERKIKTDNVARYLEQHPLAAQQFQRLRHSDGIVLYLFTTLSLSVANGNLVALHPGH